MKPSHVSLIATIGAAISAVMSIEATAHEHYIVALVLVFVFGASIATMIAVAIFEKRKSD